MPVLKAILRRLVRDDALSADVQKLRYESNYLQLEVSRLRSMVRYLAADQRHHLPMQRQTMDSFDFQWDESIDGNWMETHPEIKEREPQLVCSYTQLPKKWFAGKRVLDAGCGSGRFSWAMASMGADVTAIDQSAHGVENTRRACSEFGEHVVVLQQNLLHPVDLPADFDLVWSFGVLHHTGNTHGAFSNIARLVKPGGHIFLMLYGEPSGMDAGEFAYYTEVERLRRDTCLMSFEERYTYIKSLKGDDVGGWFDAVSPEINDTYSLYELQLWLRRAGFIDIVRTMDHPSHHIVARRPT